ncbi:hypothetical protein B5M09_007012 [Aphanomyces astaci]|uniref:U3 small nucleolar ribonucleoprotein protein IMP3 n=1 Tax=Aphanomyces astaci TaxID=112090 RepID=A0A425DEY3_APHAT|nr:hypothetical protein B5M09_007012 [Aphanomyces astaci]
MMVRAGLILGVRVMSSKRFRRRCNLKRKRLVLAIVFHFDSPSSAKMRQFKYHEKKLLKKVDLLEWRNENNLHEIKVIRRYRLPDREQYHKYNKLVGDIGRVVARLKKRPSNDPFRIKTTEKLLEKLYQMGIINGTKSLLKAEELNVSSFCRRRLPVVMVRLKMSENIKEATTFVEQGHVRVGPNTVTDPSFMITRPFEDFVTWVDSSKIKRTIHKYNDKLDDYDLLGN